MKSKQERKAQAFDDLKELYFNFDWEKRNTLDFVTELGMIITVATVDIKVEK